MKVFNASGMSQDISVGLGCQGCLYHFIHMACEVAAVKVVLIVWRLVGCCVYRVHAKYMGHPVFGDTAYGKSMSSPLGRQDETEEQW